MVEAQTSWFGDGLVYVRDHERGLLAPFHHCVFFFLPSHNTIRTHSGNSVFFFYFILFLEALLVFLFILQRFGRE
jgi:hypothetical protein